MMVRVTHIFSKEQIDSRCVDTEAPPAQRRAESEFVSAFHKRSKPIELADMRNADGTVPWGGPWNALMHGRAKQ